MRKLLPLGLLLFIPSAAVAQSECSGSGPILIGEPTEKITVGRDEIVREDLSEAEAAEFQVLISCVDGEAVYSSRNTNPLHLGWSGCFVTFLDLYSGSVVHALDVHTCGDIWDSKEMPFEYSEVLRLGIYQVIYRGRLRHFRLGAENYSSD